MMKNPFGSKKNTKKVLVVEDDSLLSKILSEALRREKFKVAAVDNGLHVQETAELFSPDIILLDLIIPGLDGFAVLKGLKAGEKTKKIPVAVLSNLGDAGDVKSTMALGADRYFIKSNTEMEKIVQYIKKTLKI